MGAPIDARLADAGGKISEPWAAWARRVDAALFGAGGGAGGSTAAMLEAALAGMGGAEDALAEMVSFFPGVPPAGPPSPAPRLLTPFPLEHDLDPSSEALASMASFLRAPAPLEALPQIDTSTGTVNQFVPTSRVVWLNNAADVTINGILAGYDGQIVTFVAVGTNPAFFNPEDAGATAADRLINTVTTGFTPIAPTGSITYRYDATAGVARWRLIAHNQGAFLSIPFASCTYDSNTGAFWTVVAGNIVSQQYYLVGRTLFTHWTISGGGTTTLAGVGTRLRINFTAYAAWTFTNTTRNYARVVDGGAAQAGMVTGATGVGALIQFSHDTADTAWGVGAGRVIDGATVQVMLQ